MIGEIYKTAQPSGYKPPPDVEAMTAFVRRDFFEANRVLQTPWEELNNRSVIDDENRGKRMFNTFVDENVENPADAWKWKGTRSMARNKGIAMHAQLTASYIIPMFMAQNEDDETDQDFSELMRDLAEWMVDNSGYKSSFLSLIFGVLTNPVTYLGAEYCEVYQKIKSRQTDGSLTTKEVIDEVLSGYQAPVYGPSQILITNAYLTPSNFQKQRVVFKREYIEWATAQAEFGTHPNWDHVRPGVKTLYNDEDGLFYDTKDESHREYLVEKVVAYYRRDDTEVVFLNGIYMGKDDVEANPICHRDNRDAPKYNVIPFGYSRVGEHFFYYKSMMNALGWDNSLIDAMYELTMNREILDLLPPLAVFGDDKIDSEIIFPSSVVPFADTNAKIAPLLPARNPSAGYQALRTIEESIADASLSDPSSGQLPEKGQLATSVATANQNAKILLSSVGKSLAESMCQYGSLMADIAVNHITVPQVDEILGGDIRLKYRSFVLNKKNIDGKALDKHIRFDPSLMGTEMNDKDKRAYNLKLLEESGYPDNHKAIYVYNPELFRSMKYLSRIEPQELFPKNEEFMQAMLTNLYETLALDPMVDHEALLRKLLHAYFRSEGDKLILKTPQQGGMPMPGQPGAPGQLPPGAPQAPAAPVPQPGPKSPLAAMAGARGLSTAVAGMGGGQAG